MNKLDVELGKSRKRITKAVLKAVPEATHVCIDHKLTLLGASTMSVTTWVGDDIGKCNFHLTGTTKQIIQQIRAGVLY